MGPIHMILIFLRALSRRQAGLAPENLALRQQLAVLQHRSKRPRLRKRDRIFWVWLSRLWTGWHSVLLIVQPDTVVAWHRQGWKLYWRWKSRAKAVGRPPIDTELRKLIRRMCRENPTWGAPRITQNWSCSVTTCLRRPLISTWFGVENRRLKPGVRFWRTTCRIRWASTFSRCRQRLSAYCLRSSYCATIDDVSFISTLRRIQRRNGRHGKSSRPSRMTEHHGPSSRCSGSRCFIVDGRLDLYHYDVVSRRLDVA